MLRYFTFLCHQQWPSETSIQRIVNIPILFLSGARDELIPPAHMAKLYELSETREVKDWVQFELGMHNDTCIQSGYFEAIREFLERRVLKEESIVEEEKEKTERTVETVHIEPDHEETPSSPVKRFETYQLVSGMEDAEGMKHSFQVEEVELEEE